MDVPAEGYVGQTSLLKCLAGRESDLSIVIVFSRAGRAGTEERYDRAGKTRFCGLRVGWKEIKNS